jgi:hypothetical protein
MRQPIGRAWGRSTTPTPARARIADPRTATALSREFLMTSTVATPVDRVPSTLRTPVAWGVVVGVLQAAAPVAFFWLEPATVGALVLRRGVP